MESFSGIWLSSISDINYYIIIHKVYEALQDLKYEYADFSSWYFNKVIPEIKSGKRDILFTLDKNNISGVLITKDDIEKKICTLRVSPNYQKHGLGKFLFEQSFKKLQTEKPIITVSQKRQIQFNKILNYYGFELACIAIHYYGQGSAECCYNGILESYEIANIKCRTTNALVASNY